MSILREIVLTWTLVSLSFGNEIEYLPIGIEVYGVNLKDDLSAQAVNDIINAVHEHSIVVFKNQGVVPAKRQREISEWFGEIAAPFEPHPETEYPGVFRISNDPKHGYLGAGNESWHIDGSFLEMPYSTSIYHIVQTPKKGNTVFASLTKMIDDLPEDVRKEWDTLYIGTDVKRTVGMKVDDEDKSACPSASPVHPLMYPHPLTGKQVLCFNMDLIKTFGKNSGTDEEVWTDAEETTRIKNDINQQIEKDDRKFIYSHEWQDGDFIITDNLAVAHMASAETQLPPSQVGLRILHRTTVQGKYRPSKTRPTEAHTEHKDEL